MDNSHSKYTKPARVAELAPTETLKRIGFKQNDVLCDIGAGTGVFTIPAASLTDNFVYAVDINKERLDIIDEKAEKRNLTNIKTLHRTGYPYSLNDNSVDFALLVTVFHEIDPKGPLLHEVRRVLRMNGKLAIIDFHKCETPIGPPVSHRITKEDVVSSISNHGFKKVDDFALGVNFYCIVFQ